MNYYTGFMSMARRNNMALVCATKHFISLRIGHWLFIWKGGFPHRKGRSPVRCRRIKIVARYLWWQTADWTAWYPYYTRLVEWVRTPNVRKQPTLLSWVSNFFWGGHWRALFVPLTQWSARARPHRQVAGSSPEGVTKPPLVHWEERRRKFFTCQHVLFYLWLILVSRLFKTPCYNRFIAMRVGGL